MKVSKLMLKYNHFCIKQVSLLIKILSFSIIHFEMKDYQQIFYEKVQAANFNIGLSIVEE